MFGSSKPNSAVMGLSFGSSKPKSELGSPVFGYSEPAMHRKRIPIPQRLPNRLQLGACIVEARRAVSLTQDALGQRIELQGRAIYRWERNETAPNDRHRRALIREIHRLNPQVGLTLQAAITAKTGKAYQVVSAPLVAEPSISSARIDDSKSPGPYLVQAPQVPKASENTQPMLDILEFAVLKMADELDVAPRRVRRALSRLLDRLSEAKLTLETLQLEFARVFAQD